MTKRTLWILSSSGSDGKKAGQQLLHCPGACDPIDLDFDFVLILCFEYSPLVFLICV